MHRYQIKIEFEGSEFVGWQFQKNGNSIQDTVQKAFSKFFKRKMIVQGSGRTDAGVHAIEQSAHVDLEQKIQNEDIFLNSINFYLNNYPISITSIKKKNSNFHARFSAKKRTYKYLIINRTGTLVLNKNKAWHIRKKLNIKLMKKGSKILEGTHDFSTFRSSSCHAKSPIRTLKKASVKKYKEKIEFTFVSKSFLQNQVRSMVGCLKLLGEGKWNLKDFKKAMKSKKRSNCGPPAPAHGLYLFKVNY